MNDEYPCPKHFTIALLTLFSLISAPRSDYLEGDIWRDYCGCMKDEDEFAKFERQGMLQSVNYYSTSTAIQDFISIHCLSAVAPRSAHNKFT